MKSALALMALGFGAAPADIGQLPGIQSQQSPPGLQSPPERRPVTAEITGFAPANLQPRAALPHLEDTLAETVHRPLLPQRP